MSSNPDHIFRLVLLAGMLVLVPIMAYHRIRSQKTGERLDRGEEGLFILLTLRPIGLSHMAGLILFIVNPALMEWSAMPLLVWLRWTGVVLGIAGGSLFIWTVRTLGPNLTDTVVTRQNHTLVTTGPYRWVRHPFYCAMAISVVANALAAANWFLLATGLVTVALIVRRTRTEEAKLVQRFGASYREYAKRTGRFIPGRLPANQD